MNLPGILQDEWAKFVEASYDGVIIADGEGKIVYMNPASEKLEGLKANQIVGKYADKLERSGIYEESATVRILKEKKPVSVTQYRGGKQLVISGIPIFQNDRIKWIIINERDVTELSRVKNELKRLKSEACKSTLPIAESKPMKKVMETLKKVAAIDVLVLLQGESGTGKGVMAKWIHENSLRRQKPLITIDCGFLPENLLESELFGYERGAFTGANREGKKVLFAALSLILFPEASLQGINSIFQFVSAAFGTPLLWFSLAATIFCFYIAFSGYGKIKLGDEKAEFSLFSYIGMMICAGLASASVYFSFVEWIYFYTGPAPGFQPMTNAAAEMAPAYSFTYWGLISWPPFALAALPIAISYYKRNNTALRFSVVCEDLFHLKEKSLIGKIIDIFFVITTLGGLSVTLGLGVPLISSMISFITGIPDTFGLQVAIVILISVIFSLSSYVGLEKGMKRISDTNIYIAIAFVLVLLITGPTVFILKFMTNGFGNAVSHYLTILFSTDPIENGGFSEAWIIFYICFAVSYAPLMSLFITKISKGRTLREMMLSTVLGGTFGCVLLFGINSGYGVHAQVTGAVNVVDTFNSSGVGPTVVAILSQLPIPITLSAIVFTLMLILFLATSLDSASFSLAATATAAMQKSENPRPLLRLFWCFMLALIPLGLMFAGAPLSAIQTICLVTAMPFAVITLVFAFKGIRWYKEEYQIVKQQEALAFTEKQELQEDLQ